MHIKYIKYIKYINNYDTIFILWIYMTLNELIDMLIDYRDQGRFERGGELRGNTP